MIYLLILAVKIKSSEDRESEVNCRRSTPRMSNLPQSRWFLMVNLQQVDCSGRSTSTTSTFRTSMFRMSNVGTSMSWTLPLGFGVRVRLLLRLGQMCQNHDHVNIDLMTHLTMLPPFCRHCQLCGSRSHIQPNVPQCGVVNLTRFDLLT